MVAQDLRKDFPPYPPNTAQNDPDLWIPPSGSTACRRPSMKNAFCFRTSQVDPVTRREVLAESKLESDIRDVALVDRRIAAVHDQPTRITYVDRNGRKRQHVLDFRFDLVSGVRVGVLVKPSIKAARDDLYGLAKLLEEQAPDVADRFVVMTERHVPRARVANAKLFIRARRHCCPQAVAAVEVVALGIRGRVSIRSLVDASAAASGSAYIAAVSLLDKGVLTQVGTDRIDMDTLVQLNAAASGRGGRA